MKKEEIDFDTAIEQTVVSNQKPKKKKKSKKLVEKRKISSIEYLISRKLAQWHDDEYDAGKDW